MRVHRDCGGRIYQKTTEYPEATCAKCEQCWSDFEIWSIMENILAEIIGIEFWKTNFKNPAQYPRTDTLILWGPQKNADT